MDYNIYKTVCTNCVYNCNGELKHIQETHHNDITTWKCVNFKPIYVEDRQQARKQQKNNKLKPIVVSVFIMKKNHSLLN